MKTPFIILTISLQSLSVSAQVGQIDSLIAKIDNNQLRGTCHYFWFLEMPSEAGRKLLQIGEPATKKLVEKLTDSNKGIVAHYILTNIWVDSIRSWSTFEHFDRDSSVHYGYNGLAFYERHNQWYVLRHDLEENKNKWIKLLAERCAR